jgi:hypothetical protein
MAAPIIKIKRSSVPGKIPTTVSLPVGEFGINTYDGKVYIQQDQGGVGVGSTVIVVNPWSVGLGSDTYNTYFTSGNVGIGTTIPTSSFHVVGNTLVTGIVTATGGFNLGISSAGTSITSGPVTRLNFIGVGNTFAVNGTTVDISIASGGGGGASVSISTEAPTSPNQGDLWYSSLLGRTFIYYVDEDSSQWVDAAPFNIPQDEPELAPGKTSGSFTATEGQIVFNYSYNPGFIDVFLNGIRLNGTEFIASNGTSITLITPASVNDVLDVVEYRLGIGATGPTGPAAQLTIGGRTQVYTTNVSDVGVEILLRTGISTATI